jgi:23S rRNA (uracil1939-C5)-methyltransferase
MIADAMQRIGKREVALPDVKSSPSEWRYRTKLTLTLRRRGSGGWIAGLHAYDDPTRVFPLTDCLITDRRVIAAWREILAASQFFPDTTELRGSVRWTDDGPTFVLTGARRWSDHANFFAAVPTLAALYWEALESPRMTLGDRRKTRTPAASFAQVNPAMAEQLRAHVAERVFAYKPRTVVDAYSGSGDLALTLAERGVNVTAIELDADASAWAEARLPASSRAVRARVEEVLSHFLPADLVVLNPPRAGVHQDVPVALDSERGPGTIVYVSCDPATLSRDIARLPGYRVASVVAFDMFPQTSHVETVCELVREAA